MVKTIEAWFDGKVLHPAEPLALEPNTRVRIAIEMTPPDSEQAVSFLQVAKSLNLEGPSDWSENLENYLYSGHVQDED